MPDTADDSGADGMRVDRDGRLYVATRMGIQVCDQAGRVNCIIPTPNGKVSNLCFGGENFDTLFATCGDQVYKRKVKVQGASGSSRRSSPRPQALIDRGRPATEDAGDNNQGGAGQTTRTPLCPPWRIVRRLLGNALEKGKGWNTRGSFGTGLLAGTMNAAAGGSYVPSRDGRGRHALGLGQRLEHRRGLPGSLASAWAYRDDFIPFEGVSMRALFVVSLAGGLIGALLLATPSATFDGIVPWLLLVGTFTFAFGRQAASLRRVTRIGPRTYSSASSRSAHTAAT